MSTRRLALRLATAAVAAVVSGLSLTPALAGGACPTSGAPPPGAVTVPVPAAPQPAPPAPPEDQPAQSTQPVPPPPPDPTAEITRTIATTPTVTAPPAPPEGPPAGCPPVRRPPTAATRAAAKPASDAASRAGGTLARDKRHGDKRHRADGASAPGGPGLAFSIPGPLQIGVPDSLLDSFRIPPFLLPIYQAAGTEYGVPWQVLASINEIETGYGRNLNVSPAGAIGWMQFLASSWRAYGVDANGDGQKDPYNPVDAIFAAARYLKAAGAQTDLRRAVFAYNHADWYVESVMARAGQIGELPPDLVAALSGLAEGRFPVAGPATYRGGGAGGHELAAAATTAGSPAPRGIDIQAREGAAVVAVNDGVVTRVGRDRRLGRFVELRDVYGNRYTYSQLGGVARSYLAPRPVAAGRSALRSEVELPSHDAKPSAPASAGRPVAAKGSRAIRRPRSAVAPTLAAPGGVVHRRLRAGARVVAGTVLGRIAGGPARRPAHVHFTVRPAGQGAPDIDPRPILDGWRLLEATGVYGPAGNGRLSSAATDGQVLLAGKEALARRLLADPRVHVYECGRRDVETGQVDRRVLATLEFLAASGLSPTVTSLRCGHSYLTAGGNVSEHSFGDAVDIAAINGIPILGHQGPGSITEQAIRRILTLQGSMRPHQIISLMTFQGAPNTLSLPDHANHIHVGFQPLLGAGTVTGAQPVAVLEPDQWARLTDRVSRLYAPAPSSAPSEADVRPPGDGGDRHPGERSKRRSGGARDAGQRRPAIKPKSPVIEPGGRLALRGRGWTCPDGSPATSTTVTLGEGGALLGDAQPNAKGSFKLTVTLAKALLGAAKPPITLPLYARSDCGAGDELSTAGKHPSILVVDKVPSGGGNDTSGDEAGSGGGGGGAAGPLRSTPATRSPTPNADGSDEPGAQGQDSQGVAGQSVSHGDSGGGGGENDSSSHGGGDSGSHGNGDSGSNDKSGNKHHRHRDKGGGGDGGGGAASSAAGTASDKRVHVPKQAPPLMSAARAAASPALGTLGSIHYPQPASPFVVLAICALVALALAAGAALGRRWMRPPPPPAPQREAPGL